MKRDYTSDRVKKKRKVHRQYGSVSSFGVEKPYNELLDTIGKFAKTQSTDKATKEQLQKLAWFLGENGETDACEVIMENLTPPPVHMYGYFG